MTTTDQYFQIFFDYVRLLHPISESEMAVCREYMRPFQVAKGEFLSKENKIPRYHNFIVSGHVRKYHFDDNHEEVTVDMNDGPRFFTSYAHFVNRSISNENLECITDCEVLKVSRNDVDLMAKNSIGQIEYTVAIMHQALEDTKQRMIDRSTLSAEERYLKLLRNQPEIVRQYPMKHIASYLGIQPGSLSRIRKELTLSKV